MRDRFSSITTWENGAQNWPSSERKKLVCCRVVVETHDVKTFEFCTEDGLPVRFEPGQFLTVSANVNGQSLERCYTISSPPTRPFLISITVKRVPEGSFSNWLHDNMAAGAQLLAYGPSGNFTSTASSIPKALYLSAGSGVTPLMSMTRASLDLGLDRDIAFVHSARTPADIVFYGELQRMVALSANLKLFFVCEGTGDVLDYAGATGRLSLELLSKWLPDFAEREVFTCGPGGYMAAVREILRQGHFNPANYHQESFDIKANLAPQVKAEEYDTSGKLFTVKLAKSSKTFTMSGAETVLSAARKAGAVIPSSCTQGVCGTCKTRLLEGTVEMNQNGGIRQREIEKGFRLLCCSRPTSDLVLEL